MQAAVQFVVDHWVSLLLINVPSIVLYPWMGTWMNEDYPGWGWRKVGVSWGVSSAVVVAGVLSVFSVLNIVEPHSCFYKDPHYRICVASRVFSSFFSGMGLVFSWGLVHVPFALDLYMNPSYGEVPMEEEEEVVV